MPARATCYTTRYSAARCSAILLRRSAVTLERLMAQSEVSDRSLRGRRLDHPRTQPVISALDIIPPAKPMPQISIAPSLRVWYKTRMASNRHLLSAQLLPNYLGEAALRARRKWTGKAGAEERDRVLKTTGSPGFKATKSQARQVEMMAVTGLDAKTIGAILGIDKKLVEFYYAYELKTAAARALIPVAKAAYEMASDKRHPDITKFVLQARGGEAWTPKSQVDHTGLDKDADDARAARAKLLEGDEVQTPSAGGERT